jgi:hypothetical protein
VKLHWRVESAIDFNREDGILLHLGLRGVATIMPMDRKSLSTSAQKYLENPKIGMTGSPTRLQR